MHIRVDIPEFIHLGIGLSPAQGTIPHGIVPH